MRRSGGPADFLCGSDAMRPSYPNQAADFKRNKNSFDREIYCGKIFHMTVSKTGKSQLTIRGLVDAKGRRHKKRGMSATAFAKLYRSRAPLDADAAKEIAANLAATDKGK